MKVLKAFYIITVLVVQSNTSFSQEKENKKSWISKHPLEFSLGSHAIGLPFNNLFSNPLYPEINIGLQTNFLDKNKLNFNVVNGLGFASHPFNGNRYFINTFFRVKYKFPLNIYSQIGLGLAFNVLDYPNTVFELNSNGAYEEKKSFEVEFYSGFNIEIGYHFEQIKLLDFDVFTKYNSGVNLFHHPSIPIFPYNSIQLGARFYLQNNTP